MPEPINIQTRAVIWAVSSSTGVIAQRTWLTECLLASVNCWAGFKPFLRVNAGYDDGGLVLGMLRILRRTELVGSCLKFSQNLGAGWLAALFRPLVRLGIRSGRWWRILQGCGVSDVITATIGSERLRGWFSDFSVHCSPSAVEVQQAGGPIGLRRWSSRSRSGRWLAMNEGQKTSHRLWVRAMPEFLSFSRFSLEIIVGEWSILTILPTIISAVSATVSRILMGNKIAFYQDIAGYSFVSSLHGGACLTDWFPCSSAVLVLGKSVSSEKNLIRATTGGLLVGCWAGNAGSTLRAMTSPKNFFESSDYALVFILLLLFHSLWNHMNGGVGGVFAPSLVIGSGVGLACGCIRKTAVEGWQKKRPFSGRDGRNGNRGDAWTTNRNFSDGSNRGYSMISHWCSRQAAPWSSVLSLKWLCLHRDMISKELVRRGTDRSCCITWTPGHSWPGFQHRGPDLSYGISFRSFNDPRITSRDW